MYFKFIFCLISTVFLNYSLLAKETPNVLFICIDDLRNDLGCYGNSTVKSPNLDALSKRGIRFDRHYVQVAVCNPSRTSMLLGMRPDKSRVFTLSCKFQDHVPWAVSIPQYFATQGYHSVGIGKIDHGTVDDPQNWSEPKLRGKNFKEWSKESIQNLKDWKKDQQEKGKSDSYVNRRRANCIEMEDVPDSRRFDGAVTDSAIEKLKELKQMDKPFFFAIGYVKPHMPFNAPKKYWDMYDRSKLPLSNYTSPPIDAPKVASNTNYELRDYIDFAKSDHPHEGSISVDQARSLIHGYYACVSYMDAQVGRLIKALDENGLSSNTIIVVWSDHGWKLGDFKGWGKMTNYELDTRSPLIIIDPRLKNQAGTFRRQLVESLDLFPTLCDMAGLPKPLQLDGKSLQPLLKNASTPSRKAAYSQYFREKRDKQGNLFGLMGRAVRTDKFRYIVWRDFKSGLVKHEELYEVSEVSYERKNIYQDEKYRPQLLKMRTLEQTYWPEKYNINKAPSKKKTTRNKFQ